MRNAPRGFTVVELLIALGVIGLIGVFASIAVGSARSRSRDAVRLSQVRQVQAALENRFNSVNGYPAGTGVVLGAVDSACLDATGFAGSCSESLFLSRVPALNTTGLDHLSVCGDPAVEGYCYLQTENGASYRLQFELEHDWAEAGVAQGLNCGSPDGISAGACR